MKKTAYISPTTKDLVVEPEKLVCASIKDIGGDADIEIGEGEIPETADSRSTYKVWSDEDEVIEEW